MTTDDFHNTVKIREHKVQKLEVEVFQFAAEESDFSLFSSVMAGPGAIPRSFSMGANDLSSVGKFPESEAVLVFLTLKLRMCGPVYLPSHWFLWRA